MGALGISVLLLAAGGRDLLDAAASSPRPAECRPSDGERGGLWRLSRSPALGRYCDLLGRGYSSLLDEPRQAQASAEAAEAAWPGQGATRVLLARARLRLGDFTGAWQAFERLSGHPTLLQNAEALHDFAVCAVQNGHLTQARGAYQRLVSRVSLLTQPERRLRVYLESSVLAMSAGPEGLKEAIGILAEARRSQVPPGVSWLLTATLALALDRAGQTDRARALVGEIEGPGGLARWVQGQLPGSFRAYPVPSRARHARVVLLPGEFEALVGILAERDDPVGALAAWRDYRAKVNSGPWLGHAQAKANALAARLSKSRRP
jgi:hypothetical protein